MNVRRIIAESRKPEDIPALLDQAGIGFEPIACVNWNEYPYRPEVRFRIAYTEGAFLLHYRVKENSVRARYGTDNGSVWTDSCVEFFLKPGNDEVYYNIECNCAGTVLLEAGVPGEKPRERAPLEVVNRIGRWASLGRKPFEERIEETEWEVALWIPLEVFFRHSVGSLEGQQIRANFYKCGDELQTPHFLSWNPIGLPKPNFHCPEFFGQLTIE